MAYLLNRSTTNTILIKYNKPAKTYSQLIYGLKNKGLDIPRGDEYQIIQHLKRHNYYSIVNGNKDIFIDKSSTKEKFIPSTNFYDLMFMYSLDQDIKNNLFQYILEIEVSLKSKLGYIIGNNISVKEPKVTKENGNYIRFDFQGSYLDKQHYHPSAKMGFLASIARTIYKTKNNPTKHYRENKNHIPPWIAFENLYLYQIKDLCKFLSTDNKKEFGLLFSHIYDSNNHSINFDHILNSIGIIHEFRNKVAHGQRFYNYKADESYLSHNIMKNIFAYDIVSSSEYSKGIGKNDIFALLIAIITLIDNPYKAQLIVSDLPRMLTKYKNEDAFLKATNMPQDYRERLNKLIRSIY